MTRREFMRLLGGGAALAAMPVGAQGGATVAQGTRAGRPNIVFFLVDDMGWQDTSLPFWYPNNGAQPRKTALNGRYRTPNMERMAREGMLFSSAYAQPVCSPTRVSVLSGMNAARHRVTNWTSRVDHGPGTEVRVNGCVSAPWAENGLQPPGTGSSGTTRAAYGLPDRAYPDTPETPYAMARPYVCAKTLPMFLREAGYLTVMAGKAHFAAGNGFASGVMSTPGANPRLLGFDVNLCGSHKGRPSNYRPDKGPRYGGEIFGLRSEQESRRFLTNALTREAIATVESAQSARPGRPFFLYLGHFALHTPYDNAHAFDPRRAADADVLKDTENPAPSDGLPWNAMERNYRNLIAGMDESLGHILDWSADQKVRTGRDTLVVFMGDNGGLAGRERGAMDADIANAPLRDGKGSCYEGGIREPFVVWMPGTVKAGAVSHAPIVCEDLFPTFLDYAGLDPSALKGLTETPSEAFPDGGSIRQSLDGVSLRPIFEGRRSSEAIRPILIHSPNVWIQSEARAYNLFTVLRMGDWKLVWHQDLGELELFNVVSDISERRNQAAARPALTAKLARRMGDLLRERGAQRPTRDGVPVLWPDEL